MYSTTSEQLISCNCLYGEYLEYYRLNDAYLCKNCQKGTYAFPSFEKKDQLQCKICPEGANCPGAQ